MARSGPRRERRGRARGAVPALFAVLLLAALCAAPTGAAADPIPGLGAAWFEAGRLLAERGEWDAAAGYAAEAAALDPRDSDYRYFNALAALKTGKPIALALSEAEAAIAAGAFRTYSVREASTLKAELLVRSRRYSEALAALGRLAPSNALEGDARWIRARALLGLGERGAFVDEIGEAVRRFPDDPRFPRLFLERVAALGPAPSAAARALGDLILARLERYARVDPELPVLAAAIAPNPALRRDAVLAYRAMGGSSAAATLRALEYGLVDEARAAAELVSGAYRPRVGDISAALALAGSEAGRAAIRAALAAFTGTVYADRDGDGIAEESLRLAAGLPAAWSVDLRQDGSEELRVDFAGGVPLSFSMSKEGLALRGTYEAYPFLASLSFEVSGGPGRAAAIETYYFRPGSFSFAPISRNLGPDAAAGVPGIVGATGSAAVPPGLPSPTGEPFPLERAASAAALAVRTSSADSGEEYLTELENGVPLRRETYASGRVVARLEYERGLPLIERVDADRDGRFETERLYEGEGAERAVAWIRIDAEGKGLFGYREQTGFPFRKEWDLNSDGAVDAVQFAMPDGATRREFSTRLDGRLDEILVSRDGRLVSLEVEGRRPQLSADANPRLTWIGRKPFDLGGNLPGGEGVYSWMGSRYRLIFVGDQGYAEVVP